ncbi:MAG: hypothetical protein L3J79_04080 [Candidatus Marinimicrobia bacterium]|nr:hypothetical protein [Candidatus Neomarinimicrobiota bacterium]
MAKPNYAFAKHQRDLAKKKKKEEKRRLKAEAKLAQNPEANQPLQTEEENQDQPAEES